MAADLRFVVHAAEADAHELAAHGARDRLAERGLADAGRTDEAQDRRLALRRELAHGEILDDAALDLVETVMILVEDAARLGDVDRLSPPAAPTAARSASRDRCAPCRIRPPLPACARSRRSSLRACSSTSFGILALVIASLELGDLGAPCRRRPRRAASESRPSARAAELRAGVRRARPWSAGRSPATAAAPRCDARAAATPCRCARRYRPSPGSPASPRASMSMIGRREIGECARRIDALDGGEQFLRRLRQ